MKMIRPILKTTGKIILTIILAAWMIVLASEFSPIYKFAAPKPFEGEKIYNPYASLDTSIGWSRANFHTHTHASKWINECEFYPDKVLEYYDRYRYDIISFSNHMELTEFPGDTSRQIWVYEHGYNLFKFHKLVFGARKVNYFDNFIPILLSQKQFQLDLLAKDCDFLVLNHPDRTNNMGSRTMKNLTGYRMMEADAGAGTDLRRWDEALSAGKYSYNLINDDLHEPRLSYKIARRCSWLNTPSRSRTTSQASISYEDIKQTLLQGNFYSMNIPDFGDGDLAIKLEENLKLPKIKTIGMRGDTIHMTLSSPAKSIEVIGQNGMMHKTLSDTSSVTYVIRDEDPYIRMTARFDNGVVIYTNPFARYSSGDSPYAVFPHPIWWSVTILFNLLIVSLIATMVFLIKKCWKKRN